ncbi:hypothetical protein [Flavobacterium terrisoli]|uniref:Cap15 family cyclic dinucleotide receptor domain-containing protein n=1 Tax=Flavobacterium terrisoli TaxID=3242195 RepID=UPI0025430081|nr:hypothetical protein [Flavobacterium buctense]
MNLQHYNITLLIILIIALYGLFNLLFIKITKAGFKLFQIPSIFSVILGIVYLINTYCWNWWLINPLLVNVPDISGTYNGVVNIRHLDNKTKEIPPVKVVIKQTGTNLDFDLYSKKGSHSTNIVSELVKQNGLWYLYIIYKNENTKNPENRNRYEGVSKFEIHNEKDTINLVGQFYTDETHKAYGTIKLKRTSK